MASTKAVKIDPKELKRAEEIWANFISMSKWGIIACVVVMLGLAAAFVPFGS